MEKLIINNQQTEVSSDKVFIDANTVPATLDEIKTQHLIPTFKDGEPVISHSDFIEAAYEAVSEFYFSEAVLKPTIRLSHPIRGRKPESKSKPLQYCEAADMTVYFDRCFFAMEIPGISEEIDGNLLSLTVGGIKVYNDVLHTNKTADQKFKIFVGFKVKICSNLKIWNDGINFDVKVNSLGQLQGCIKTMLENYNANYHIHTLKSLVDYDLTEKQFAQFLGRCRLYQHLSPHKRTGISPLLLTDSQFSTVVKEYYSGHFSKSVDGSINLWKMYNLLTEAAKSSYIDTYIEKVSNAFQVVQELKSALDNKTSSWFLN